MTEPEAMTRKHQTPVDAFIAELVEEIVDGVVAKLKAKEPEPKKVGLACAVCGKPSVIGGRCLEHAALEPR